MGHQSGYTFGNLSPKRTYDLRVTVTDNAGNVNSSTSSAQTIGRLNQPGISLSGQMGNNNWYTGNVTVTITDGASASETEATGLYYEVVNQSNNVVVKTGNGGVPNTTFNWTTDGYYTVRAWAQDSTGSRSTTVENTTLKRDATPPTIDEVLWNADSGNSITLTCNKVSDNLSGVYCFHYTLDGDMVLSSVNPGATFEVTMGQHSRLD